MDIDDILQDEYPFGFIYGPLSLLTLASTELSLVLWRHKIFNGGNTLQNNFSCDEFLKVPSTIKDVIDGKISSMGEDLRNWARFCSQLGKEMRPIFLSHFDDIVCDPNGRISFKKTATKVLQRNLDFKLKYKIACTFCLGDEIVRIFPSMLEDCKVFLSRDVKKSKSSFYWYCRMMNTPQNDSATPENRVMEAYRKRNWAALQYHWSTLNDDQRIPMALEVFKYNNVDAMMCILPKLNEYQAQKVFEAKPWEILSILISNHEYIEHMLALWTRMEKVVSEGVFLQLIRGLWRLTWNTSKADCMERYKMDGSLTEIWTKAPDQFKSYVLNHAAEFFDNLSLQNPRFFCNYAHDMEFLLDLLRNNSAEFRETIWTNNWQKIVMRAKPVYLKQFVELCLPDDKAIDDFKSDKLLSFRLIYFSLIKYGFYSDLAEYLNFSSETTVIEKKTSKQILTNHAGLIISSLLDSNNFKNFDSFVDRLFPDSDGVAEFKQSLLLSPRSERSLFGMFNSGRLEDFQKIIGLFATSEENLQELKSEFLQRSRKYLTSTQRVNFDVTRWIKLLKWCTKNEDEIVAFKKSLDIDAIFETLFNPQSHDSWTCCYHFPQFCSCPCRLFFYDNFSNWYFVDDQAIKDFKLRKVNDYEKGKAVRTFLEKASRIRIFRMLNWAFDNDSKKVLKFQKRLVQDKVLTSVIKAYEFYD